MLTTELPNGSTRVLILLPTRELALQTQAHFEKLAAFTAAKDAGLVMDESIANFLAADPGLGGDPRTLNLASMMNSNCVGTCSWTRTVTNPDNSTNHWNVTASGDGFDATAEVSPEANSDDYNLKLKKGKSADITVTADTTFSSPGWHFGK